MILISTDQNHLDVLCQPKVNYLHLQIGLCPEKLKVQECQLMWVYAPADTDNVVWFDVEVDDVVVVHEHNPRDNLYPRSTRGWILISQNNLRASKVAIKVAFFGTMCIKQARKARKTRTSPGTLGLKKFGLGKLGVKKVFRKIHFQKIHFRKIHFWKIHFAKNTLSKNTV